MKKGLILLSLLLMFSLVNLVSAEILISQPNSVYNLADTLSFKVTLQPAQSSNEFALISVVCGASDVDVYRSPVTLAANEVKTIEISFPLTASIIGSSSGSCAVRAKYGTESRDSSQFSITNNIDVQINMNNVQYSPGDLVVLTGKAIREDGLPANGFLRVEIANNTLTFPVKQGNISANFSLARDIAPGDANVEFQVYEKDSLGGVSNTGQIERNIRIKQVVKSVSISLDSLEVAADKPLAYTLDAFDQIGSSMSRDISLVVSRPDGTQYLTRLVHAGNTEYLLLPSDVDIGVWTMTASLDGLIESKTFSVPEIKRVKFDIFNDTLVVKNIGNVPYVNSIEVAIGNKTIVKQLNLQVNGSKTYKLLAPDANYQVSVSDGYTNLSAFSIPLTGRAVDLGEVKSFSGSIIPALIIVGLILIVYIVLKVRKIKSFGSAPKSYSEFVQRTPLVKAAVSQDASMDEGSRETAAIIALKLPDNLPAASQEVMSSLKQKAASRRAHSELRGNFMLFLFTEKLSGAEYEMNAIKLAQEIQKTIKSGVSSANVQVPCSIGITKGEVITSGSFGRLFSFTALGNAISKAQRLASQANGEILVTDSIKARVGTQVRLSRVPGVEAWKVESVVNRDEYSGFVSGFVKRQSKK